MDREKYLAPHLNLPGPSAVADDPTEGRKAVRLRRDLLPSHYQPRSRGFPRLVVRPLLQFRYL